MEQLGIEANLLLAQLVNFSIILFVLSKLLYKPILAMLAKRKKEIEEGLALTEKLRHDEEAISLKKAKLLDEAKKEGRMVIEEAKKQGKEEEKEILAHAHKEASAIIEKAKADAERLKKDMEKGVRADAINLAVAMTKRLVGTVLSGDAQHKLIEKHIRSISEVKS